MLFVLIIAIFIAFSYESPVGLWWRLGSAEAALAALGMIAVVWLLAEAFARGAARRLARPASDAGPIMRRYQQLRWLHTVVLLSSHAALIHGVGWPRVVRHVWGLERWPVVDDVLVLAPFLVAVVLSWLAHYRVEDSLRRRLAPPGGLLPPFSRWSHLDFLFRHHLAIVLVPLLALLAIDDGIRLLVEDRRLREWAALAGAVAAFLLIIVLAPLLLRVLWRAEPLPAGPLRQRLERLSRRLRFRASNILVWNTHGAVINAAVAGIFPWLRYVLLSDGLLVHLSDEEVEAVFGHEVGHVRHHHLWFFAAFLAGAMLFVTLTVAGTRPLVAEFAGESARARWLSLTQRLAVPLSCVGVYFGVFFGFLSRRFERQADIFGCRAVSCGRPDCPPHVPAEEAAAAEPTICLEGISIFVRALEKISRLNGSPREARSWRHFSVAKRVAFLERLAAQPQLEPRFQRFVLLLKGLVVAGIVLAGGWLWYQAPVAGRQLFEMLR